MTEGEEYAISDLHIVAEASKTFFHSKRDDGKIRGERNISGAQMKAKIEQKDNLGKYIYIQFS